MGETGLDYYRTRDAAGQARQREAFAAHIGWATAYDKTLVIHDRDAHAAVLDVLEPRGSAAADRDALLLRRRDVRPGLPGPRRLPLLRRDR